MGKFLPPDWSTHGHEIDQLMGLVHWLMLILFVGWGAYFVFVLFRFRAGRNPTPSYAGAQTKASSYAEVVVALVEGVLLIGFAVPIWASRVQHFPPQEEAVQVRVVAEQFAWNVHYPGADGIFGKTDIQLVNNANPLGLDPSDSHAVDDITTINQLHLPVNRPVIVQLSSKDVIHSFFLPVMRVKQDAIPGMTIPVWFEATKTGRSEIACAQLCGLGHYRMRGFLTIHSQEDYDAWLAEQAASG